MSITNFWPRSALTRRALPDTMATFGRSLAALRWVALIQFTNLAQKFVVGVSTLKLFYQVQGCDQQQCILTHIRTHAQQHPLTQRERNSVREKYIPQEDFFVNWSRAMNFSSEQTFVMFVLMVTLACGFGN